MRWLKLTPAIVAVLLAAGLVLAWLAARMTAEPAGLAGATEIALWFLAFVLLALLVSVIATVVVAANLRKLSRAEIACGTLPLLTLLVAMFIGYLAIT